MVHTSLVGLLLAACRLQLPMASDEERCAEEFFDIVYLHGFGCVNPSKDSIATSLRADLSSAARLHTPCYHPAGDVSATRLERFIEELREAATSTPVGRFTAIIGYSVGGLLAALFQERHPDLVERVVLLAPAIDNFARNFEGVPPQSWYMPAPYVEELRRLSARPTIKVPAVLIHGALDNDAGGSDLWRIKEWAASESFEATYYPANRGHSPEIVGASDTPSWSDLSHWAIHRKPPPLDS